MNCCYGCAQFKILYEPLKSGGDIWDFGRAKCLKHDLIVDFPDHRKLKKLVCIEEEKPDTEEGKQRNEKRRNDHRASERVVGNQ